MVTVSARIADDLWLCTDSVATNDNTGAQQLTFEKLWNKCNEARGFYMPSEAALNERGLPSVAVWKAGTDLITTWNDAGACYVTFGQPVRGCNWGTTYPASSCNFAYLPRGPSASSSYWSDFANTGTNDNGGRTYPGANPIGYSAYHNPTLCMAQASAPNAHFDPSGHILCHSC